MNQEDVMLNGREGPLPALWVRDVTLGCIGDDESLRHNVGQVATIARMRCRDPDDR